MLTRLLLALGFLGVLFAAGCSDPPAGQQAPGSVTFTVFDETAGQMVTPIWLAFQDGVNGAWTPLTGAPPYTMQITNAAGAYGFAFVTPGYQGNELYLFQGTRADAAELTYPIQIIEAAGATRSMTWGRARPELAGSRQPELEWYQQGDLHNVPAGMDYLADASWGNTVGGPIDTTEGLTYFWTFTNGVPGDGAVLLGDTTGETAVPGVLYLRRNLDRPAGIVVTQDVDFAPPYDGAKDTWQCRRGTFTVPGVDTTYAMLNTVNHTSLLLCAGDPSPATYFIPPASALLPTDRYVFDARNNTDFTEVVHIGTKPITEESLPEPFTCTVDQQNGIRLQGLAYPAARAYSFWLGPETGSNWEGYVTAAWLQTAGRTDYALPDLSALPGWQPAWSLTAPLTFADVGAIDYSTTLADFLISDFDPTAVNNATFKLAWNYPIQ